MLVCTDRSKSHLAPQVGRDDHHEAASSASVISSSTYCGDENSVLMEDDVYCPNKVFVGGLGHSTGAEQLREYFEMFGKVTGCAVVRHRRSGRSRGFGFVTFENVGVATLVGSTSHTIDGVVVECRPAVPRSESRPVGEEKQVNRSPSPQPLRKVFIGGLPDGTTEEELECYCRDKFGPVESVSIPADRQTRRSRGFGFVVFKDPSTVNLCTGFQKFNGKTVEVKPAIPKAVVNEGHSNDIMMNTTLASTMASSLSSPSLTATSTTADTTRSASLSYTLSQLPELQHQVVSDSLLERPLCESSWDMTTEFRRTCSTLASRLSSSTLLTTIDRQESSFGTGESNLCWDDLFIADRPRLLEHLRPFLLSDEWH